MSGWAWLLLGVVLGAVGLAVGLWAYLVWRETYR
jgi:hypothetical protein